MNLKELQEIEIFKIFVMENNLWNKIFINTYDYKILPNYYGYTKIDGKYTIFYKDEEDNIKIMHQSTNQLEVFIYFAANFELNYLEERKKIINKGQVGFNVEDLYIGTLGKCIKTPNIPEWPYLFVKREIDPYVIFVKKNESIIEIEVAIDVLSNKEYPIFKGYIDNSVLNKSVGREVIFGNSIEPLIELDDYTYNKYGNISYSQINDIITKKNEENNKKVIRRIRTCKEL